MSHFYADRFQNALIRSMQDRLKFWGMEFNPERRKNELSIL